MTYHSVPRFINRLSVPGGVKTTLHPDTTSSPWAIR